MPVLFVLQTLLLLHFWFYCFRHPGWNESTLKTSVLFPAPFLCGCLFLWLDLHLIPLNHLHQWHHLFCAFCTLTILLLLPQWYRLMWMSLTNLSANCRSDTIRLVCAVLFSVMMMLAIIFFFALYYLWLDRLSGYTQGLCSAGLDYQPVLLDFSTAFHFSFSCYFSLGYGMYYPYGNWFYLLVFLECLIALINNGIIVCYAFHLLFEEK